MEVEKPRAKGDAVCPFHRQLMVKVCHKCPLWINIMGVNPQTGEHMDRWDCSFAWMPFMVLENSQQTRQAGAAIESMRNEMVQAQRNNLAMAAPYLTEAAKRLEKINESNNHS